MSRCKEGEKKRSKKMKSKREHVGKKWPETGRITENRVFNGIVKASPE